MKICLADTVMKLEHNGYIGFRGTNPNIKILPLDESDYVWYACWGDGDTVCKDLFKLSAIAHDAGKKFISVTLGDHPYATCLRTWDMPYHFSTATRCWDHCVPYACDNADFPDDGDRPILASFRGSLSTNPNRNKLLAVAGKDIVIEPQEWWGLTDEQKTPHYQRHFFLMDHSKFTFCPSGYGLSTTRLHEAMLHHSVPIMVGDNVRLFGQPLDFALQCGFHDLKAAVSFLRQMDDREYHQRLRDMEEYRSEYLLRDIRAGCKGTLGFTEWIREKVEAA